jgi:predicted NAD-dependent protein-ADP-ribosyltransferase YbiA (DUF1768 family)
MELLPSDAETLRSMVTKEWFPHEERELEATFGTGGVVDSTRFLAVAQRLKSKGFHEVRQPDRLTISLEDNTRYTIQGEGTIAQYCEDNTIVGKSAVAMIKDRAGDLHTLDIKDYDTRVKIRRELPLDLKDPRVKSHFATWDQRVKFFRLIQRWTFIGKGCIYDLSMVRSTKKDDRGLWKQVTKFYDEDKHHNIMKEQPSYEIEVELDRTSEDCDTPTKAVLALIQGIGDVLRGIQRNPVLIRNSVKEKVLQGYKELVGASEEVGRRGFRGVQPITLERQHIQKFSYNPKIGNIRKGYNVTDKADGLRVMGYCDSKGELFMLDMGLNVYRTGLKKQDCANTLVDGEWVTQNKDGEAIQMLMLFDIYIGFDGKNVDSLPFYEAVGEVPSRYNELRRWTSVWRMGDGPIALVKGLTPQNQLKVMEKKFLFAKEDETEIFAKCAQMLERDVNYHTDGLILTENKAPLPDKFGVRFNKQFKWKPAKDNTIDFLVKVVKDSETNQDKLTDIIRPDSLDTVKYKTLRLYVGTSADPAYDDPRRTILMVKKLPSGRPGGRGAKKYRMRPVLFNPKSHEDSMASVCYLEAKEDIATGDWVVRCSTSEDAPGVATGDPITNNSIVEMRYDPDPTLPSGWNWVPIRVRYDKTERFQGGSIDKTLNSIDTADSVWSSIHDPVTLHMIKTGSESPSPEEIEQVKVAKERSTAVSHRYYQKKSTIKNVSLVKGMSNFHNLAIKGDILTKPILQNMALGLPAKKKVLDTSIGKGGDLNRYKENVEFLLGIDIDAEGIRDPDEGAYRRYLDTLVEASKSRFESVPTMLFLIGDSSKSYANGSSGINEEESDMMRSTFGRVNPASRVPPYVDGKCKGQLKDGADLITSMFSIHYYFESKQKWEGFLANLRDNLKVGGFFVCCCFDGNFVTSLLEDIPKGESVEGVDPDTNATIWKITKENDLGGELPITPEEGFGHAIDVEFLSIGGTHREYLVSVELLLSQMSSIGCQLASDSECAALGISSSTQLFSQTYEELAAKGGYSFNTLYEMSETVKVFSGFNRWYVFRRVGKAPGARELSANTENEFLPQAQAGPFAPRSPDLPPRFVPRSPELPPGSAWGAVAPTSPIYGAPLTPAYVPTSPTYGATTTPVYAPTTPGYGAATTPVYAPTTPGYGAATTPDYGASTTPAYVPTTPNFGTVSAAASLVNRPASAAWQGVPLSGNSAQEIALRAMGPLPPRLPPGEGNEETEMVAPFLTYDPGVNFEEVTREYDEKKQRIIARGREREAAILPADISAEEREARLNAAGEAALGQAMKRYKEQAAKGAEGLVTSVVEGGARTVAVERATAAGPQKKYKAGEIFRFYGRAELKDSLGMGDPGAARWLALSAPFPIEEGGVEYPTVNHYLAGMKYKVATDKPELGIDLFSSKGTIHTKYLRQREQIAHKHKGEKERGQVKENEDQELLRSEAADVSDASLPKTIKRYKAQFDEARWLAEKDVFLKKALAYRWKHDARFRRIVEAAKQKNKYLLYYTGSSTITSFGGIRRDDGHIEGENIVGKILMELAGYAPV